jgi:hypothetical protein
MGERDFLYILENVEKTGPSWFRQWSREKENSKMDQRNTATSVIWAALGIENPLQELHWR